MLHWLYWLYWLFFEIGAGCGDSVSLRRTSGARNTVEKLLPLLCVWQMTPRRPWLRFCGGEHRGGCIVHAEKWAVLPDHFYPPGLVLREQRRFRKASWRLGGDSFRVYGGDGGV
jgi:hypothetical protein